MRGCPFPVNHPPTWKGRAAALPCPSRARRFTAVRRGRACPARNFAMPAVNGLNPSGLLRGHLSPSGATRHLPRTGGVCPGGEASLAGFARAKGSPSGVTPRCAGRCREATEGFGSEGLAELARPEGSRRALRGRPSTGIHPLTPAAAWGQAALRAPFKLVCREGS